MLSILIPTYNYNVTSLVKELHNQAINLYIDFEIIVMEDGSQCFVEENEIINKWTNCRHIILEKNIGRAAVRNKLAEEAKYDHLLFIDNDAEIFFNSFLQKYVAFCKEKCIVIGGTAYDNDFNDPQYSLRLKYGKCRESRSALERNKLELKRKSNFSAFNFMISKSIFDLVKFDENISNYGHEDTLFGHQLHELGYKFIHIDNPLIHRGIDNNKIFIQKTEEGVRNLYFLYQTGEYPFLPRESKLLRDFLFLKKIKLTSILRKFYFYFHSYLYKQLTSPHPSLFLYDVYKLLYLIDFSYQNDKMTE